MSVQPPNSFTNGHTNCHESQLQYLAACATCPEKIDYKALTKELQTTNVNQSLATRVLERLIEWKVFTKESPYTFEHISLITQNHAVPFPIPVPILALLLRSEELRVCVKKYAVDIPCYDAKPEILFSLYDTLTTTTLPVTLPTIDRQ